MFEKQDKSLVNENKIILFYFILFFFGTQEMLDIMQSIYDMMGKYTHPCIQEDAPREHVESFFQVSHTSRAIHSFLIRTESIAQEDCYVFSWTWV